MEFIKLEKEQYGEWDKFCFESDDAWFWHTSAWLFYNLNYRHEYKPEDLSFMAQKNGNIVAICPIILEVHEKVKEFSFGGYGIPIPALANNLSIDERNKNLKEIFNYIDNLAITKKVKRAKFRFPVLNKSFLENSLPPSNFLPRFGFMDTSIHSQVVDLRKSIGELRAGLRHGHKYDISVGEKIFKVEFYDSRNITSEIFKKYQDLKIFLSGKKPRSLKSFEIMFDFIKNGFAFLAVAKKGEEVAGFSYFFDYKGCVYYGSACNSVDFERLPVAHTIQWETIEMLKEKKRKYYEIGWQNFGQSLSGTVTEKDLSISKFKRGFGGFTVPLFAGEKYFDEKYFMKVYKERLKRCEESLFGTKRKK